MYPSVHISGIGKYKKHTWLVVWTLMLFCFRHCACAHEKAIYNLNKTNFLPSNRVYSFLQDKLGYLWIATEKGVVRYNGYNVRLYNKSEGLPTDDIWTMIDDNSGRVWLGGAAEQFGFVSNNKYTNAHLHNITSTIFPYYLHRLDSGIIFVSPYIGGGTLSSFCISRHDTIFPCTVSGAMIKSPDTAYREIKLHVNSNKELYAASFDHFYLVTNLSSIADTPWRLNIRRQNKTEVLEQYGKSRILCGSYFAYYSPAASNSFLLISGTNNYRDSICLDKLGIHEPIEYISYSIDRKFENKLYVYTNTTCSVFDLKGLPQFEARYDFSYIKSKHKGHRKVVQYLHLPLWDTVIATSTQGVFTIPARHLNCFQPQPDPDLTGYECIGVVYDTISFWWNSEQKLLVSRCRNKPTHTYNLKGYAVNNISEFSKDTLLLTGSFSHFITLKDHKLHKISHGIFGASVKRLVRYRPGCYYVLSGFGLCNLRPDYNTDTFRREYIATDRFKDAVFLRNQKMMVAYNDTKLLIFDEKTQKTYTARQINNTADEPIDQVCTESDYGNVFIKSGANVFIFDPQTGTSHAISTDIISRNANIVVWKTYLVVMGDFGISFFLVLGKGKLSAPVTYLNLKKGYYKEISGYAIESENVIMQTDAGIYTVKVPELDAFTHPKSYAIPYHIVLQGNSQRVLNSGDTVRLAVNTRIFYADIINPIGNGNVRIYYRFGGAKHWVKCNGNEVIIPDRVTPDSYCRFEMYCEDDGWRSPVTIANIWIEPTWMQKKSTTYLLVVCIVLLLATVVTLSVVLTRRLVNRAQQKKQMQMELELKAIYAQINPHFIFNSLTSALLLIKKKHMDEAYVHISKFSRLLRSYLHSSRNKYISIDDEVANLTNYMELQQARFKERFVGTITVDDQLDTSCHIPSLLIQPFVENAINHGILPSQYTGSLNVQFNAMPNGVQCIISDNGVGRQASRLLHKDRDPTHGSYGNLLIKDLIKVFDKYEEMKIDIRYEDQKWPNTGTIVIIDISYLH